MSEPTRETLPVQRPTQEVASWAPIACGPLYWTSVPKTTPLGRQTIMKALSACDKKSDDVVNQVLAIRDILIHPVTIVNQESAEEVECMRTVLIAGDGQTVGFVSQGVYRSVVNLITLYGPPPWSPELKVTVKSKPTSAGKRILLLEPVEEEPAHRPPRQAK